MVNITIYSVDVGERSMDVFGETPPLSGGIEQLHLKYLNQIEQGFLIIIYNGYCHRFMIYVVR